MFITMNKSLAIAVFLVICLVVGCRTLEPEGYETTSAVAGAHKDSEVTGSVAASLIQNYTLPPQSVQDFVNRSRAIVIGTVTAISKPVVERPYDFNPADFAGVPESEWPSIEVAYWTIEIEQVLLYDGNIEDNPILRMEPNPPYRTDKPLPQLNGRYLFTLGRNPDSLSYGISADWMILSLDGGGIHDLAGTAPGYVGVTGELSLVEGIRNAVPSYDFLPVGEWPLLSEAGPAGNAGEDES